MMGRWTKTYEAYGRTIEVDVPIIVPEVDEFPVFSVEPYYAVYEQRLTRDGTAAGENRRRWMVFSICRIKFTFRRWNNRKSKGT